MRTNGTLTWLPGDHLPLQGAPRGHNPQRHAAYRPAIHALRAQAPFGRRPGQISESQLGIYFYNARYYDPYLARFISPDSLIPQPGNPLAWDRYSYTFYNPIMYNDPSGHCPWCIVVGAVAGAVVSYGAQVINNYQNGLSGSEAWVTNISGEKIATGALVGATVGLGVGIVSVLIGGGAAATAGVAGAGALEVANAACGGDMCSDEVKNASQTAQSVLPAAGNAASQIVTTINTGSNVVYQYVENGIAKYYGITNNFARRAAEHFTARSWTIEKIPGLDALSRYDARAVEQVLIQNTGLPNLYNRINSIATSNGIFVEAIKRGTYILQQIGLLPK